MRRLNKIVAFLQIKENPGRKKIKVLLLHYTSRAMFSDVWNPLARTGLGKILPSAVWYKMDLK